VYKNLENQEIKFMTNSRKKKPATKTKVSRIKPIEIWVGVYRFGVVIFVGDTKVDDIVKFGLAKGLSKSIFTKSWRESIEESFPVSSGLCHTLGEDNTDIIIWLKDKPNKASEYGSLYHELYHAVDYIAHAHDREHHLSDEDGNSEARAYLYEYLATEANKKLW
jgi:hypothetical protein